MSAKLLKCQPIGWTYFVVTILKPSKSTLTDVALHFKPADTTSLYILTPVPAELKINQD
jgi:hypothetical protein